MLVSVSSVDIVGHLLGNIAYFELMCREHKVNIGKLAKKMTL